MRSHVLASLALVLAVAGCGGAAGPNAAPAASTTSSKSPSTTSPTTSAPSSPSTASVPTTSGDFRALAVDTALLTGYVANQQGQAWVRQLYLYVFDATLTGPKLFMDTGSGMRDTGAQLLPSQNFRGFVAVLDSFVATARYQVTAIRNGRAVASQVLQGRAPTATPIAITAPTVGFDLSNPPSVGPVTQVSWSDVGASTYLMYLSVAPTTTQTTKSYGSWEITTTQRSWTLGGPVQDTLLAGPSSIAGFDEVTVVGFDASGWSFATSNGASSPASFIAQ